MAQETKLFFESQVREDRPIQELLRANYTYLNERLARHYGIDDVYGSHFRRVTLTDERRYGLLGQASVLTVTSYANRTSVVLRGKWVLENLLGAPPPPPPPNVPPLKENDGEEQADCAAGTHGAAPEQPGMRELPLAHGPAGVRAGALRRGRAVARERRRGRRSTRRSTLPGTHDRQPQGVPRGAAGRTRTNSFGP